MQTMDTDQRPGAFRLLTATVAAAIALFALANAALATTHEGEIGPHTGTPSTGETDCPDPRTEFLEAAGFGWAEVALRSRGLVLVDYGTEDGVSADVLVNSADFIAIEFDSRHGNVTMRISHVDGEIEWSVVSASSAETSADGESDNRQRNELGEETATNDETDPQEVAADDDSTDESGEPASEDAAATESEQDRRPWLFFSFDGSMGPIQAGLLATSDARTG